MGAISLDFHISVTTRTYGRRQNFRLDSHLLAKILEVILRGNGVKYCLFYKATAITSYARVSDILPSVVSVQMFTFIDNCWGLQKYLGHFIVPLPLNRVRSYPPIQHVIWIQSVP